MKARFITFHYLMKDSQGALLESSYETDPMMYLEGEDQILPALESVMKDLKKGEKKSIPVAHFDAYGSRDERLVVKVPLEKLPNHSASLGQRFSLKTKELGTQIFRVTETMPGAAVLDANHPWAGIDLVFDVEIMDIRDATANAVEGPSAPVRTGPVSN